MGLQVLADDLLQVVVGAVLQPDRCGVDAGDRSRDATAGDRVAAEVEPVHAVVLERHQRCRPRVFQEGSVLLGVGAVERRLETKARFVLLQQVVGAAKRRRRVGQLEVDVDDQLGRREPLASLDLGDVLGGRVPVEVVRREALPGEPVTDAPGECEPHSLEDGRLAGVVVADQDVKPRSEIKREAAQPAVVLDRDPGEHPCCPCVVEEA